MLRKFAFSVVCLAVSSSLSLFAQVHVTTQVSNVGRAASVTTSTNSSEPTYHPSRVLVRFKAGAPHNVLPGSGASRQFPGNANLVLVENPPGLTVREVVGRYKGDANIDYAEPDYVVQSIATTPNDSLWAQQWDMTKIQANVAWDTQKDASGVVVVIIDTGIDSTHPDLQGNLWTNPGDGTHGYTCIGGSCVPGGLDNHGHGTHVAGTIGAATNNSLGIAGINWQAKMMAMKFLDQNGSGNISDAVLAFQQVLAFKQANPSVPVLTSNSWGGGGYSQALKDAMLAVEALGVVNVCAAGNSGQNADVNPMYPGGYDNRGIISVLASDASDVGAGFTNYGLANTDIAAPGVSTLSTVPTGACSLCDASGYKLLSGTSMATPHVSGVLAALLQQRKNAGKTLTAAEARDIMLDPSSYDTLIDAKAMSTSSGGRLNLPKTLANPRLAAPIVLNNFPTLTVGSNVFAASGAPVNLSATANDVDPDTLRMKWDRLISTGTQWLFGYRLASLFPAPSGGSSSFTAPTISRTATVPYSASVADNRGGGATGQQYVTVDPDPAANLPPTGGLSLSTPSIPVGGTVTVNYAPTDPEGGLVAWDVWAAGYGGANGWCCYSGTGIGITFNSAGVYRIHAQSIDNRLNLSDRASAVLSVGGATGTPPTASAVLDKLSGPAPLTININMSGSTAGPGNSILWYYYICGNGYGVGTNSNTGSCTLTNPGAYWLEFQIQDNLGNVDIISAYVVVTPPTGDNTPPTVGITSPAAGNATGIVDLKATANDASGIQKVEYHLDSSGGALIGSSTTGPDYTVSWNTTTVSLGGHAIYAIAFDNATNTGVSSPLNVTVTDSAPPAVSMTSPTNNSNVSGNVTLTATASDGTYGSGIKNVAFYRDSNVLLGTVTSAPYTMTWNSAAFPGGHTLYAIATDNVNLPTQSASVAVMVTAPPPPVLPAVSMTFPTNGSQVNTKATVNITASVTNNPTNGVSRVNFFVNGAQTCSVTGTGVSFTCAWKVPAKPGRSYSIYAVGVDGNGVSGSNSTAVNVTSK